MIGCNYDFVNNTLNMTASFAKKAGILGTPEYNQVKQYRLDNPGMKINVEKRTSKAKKVDLVTFKDMENYMNLFPEEKKAILLKQYKRVKACSKTHSSPYKFVLDWFEDYFPLYHETPEFDENGDQTNLKTKVDLEQEKLEEELDTQLEAVKNPVVQQQDSAEYCEAVSALA